MQSPPEVLADVLAARLGPLGVIRDDDGKAPYEASARQGRGHACGVVSIGPSNQRWYAEDTEPARLEPAAALHHHFDASRRLGNVRPD